ncbi:hypothetical protein C1I98_16410 [Spongiactinospora gelatinilytica]|uniref:Uncharacterized protein n=1 Tax=Spongiactinospora gelatinilytica TaxID=2666298 RepID=A0A2W2GAM9_9ACTN|nr:hypothetical protein C1I98_16410 [Spongiactinospora gelatinilytica]
MSSRRDGEGTGTCVRRVRAQRFRPGLLRWRAATADLVRASCAAWRGFRWAKGGRCFAGWYRSATTRDHAGCESWLERDRLILLDFDPQVVGITS